MPTIRIPLDSEDYSGSFPTPEIFANRIKDIIFEYKKNVLTLNAIEQMILDYMNYVLEKLGCPKAESIYRACRVLENHGYHEGVNVYDEFYEYNGIHW